MQNNNENNNPLESMAQEVYEYLHLRTTEAKLSATEHLSLLFSSAFGLILVLILGGIALLFLAVATLFWLGGVIGMGNAAIIITVIFTIAAIVVFIKRRTLIISSMIPMFLKMFFDDRNNRDNHE